MPPAACVAPVPEKPRPPPSTCAPPSPPVAPPPAPPVPPSALPWPPVPPPPPPPAPTTSRVARPQVSGAHPDPSKRTSDEPPPPEPLPPLNAVPPFAPFASPAAPATPPFEPPKPPSAPDPPDGPFIMPPERLAAVELSPRPATFTCSTAPAATGSVAVVWPPAPPGRPVMSPAGEPPWAASPAMKKLPPLPPTATMSACVIPAGTVNVSEPTTAYVHVRTPAPDTDSVPVAPHGLGSSADAAVTAHVATPNAATASASASPRRPDPSRATSITFPLVS